MRTPLVLAVVAVLTVLIVIVEAQEAIAPRVQESQAKESTATHTIPETLRDATFPVDRETLMGHVFFLSHDRLRGRDAGTAEGAISATYIAAEFRKLGLQPAGDEGGWEQSFSIAGKDDTTIETRNVLGWLPGRDENLAKEHFVVGAHFDHLGVDAGGEIFNGADDNASGIAGLLGMARACVHGPVRPRRSVLFIAFGAEEKGLRGSQYYVAHPARPLERLVAMINLDMIGRPTFLDRGMYRPLKAMVGIEAGPGVGLLGGEKAPGLFALARAACVLDGLPSYAPTDFPAMKGQIEKMVQNRDDSSVFRARGTPTIFLSTSENDDYHRPTDTLDKVDGAIVHRITRIAWRTLLAADAVDDGSSLGQPQSPAPAAEKEF